MAEQNTALTGGMAPYITIRGGRGREAIAFYKDAFGAEEVEVRPGQDGNRLMHAHLRINGSSLLMSDDFPEYSGGREAPAPASVTMHLQVDDADRWWRRATDAGATVKMELADQFWGDKYGQLVDPFGHSWSIGAPSKK